MTTETPRVRTSDAERERIAETLRTAVGDGRLTLEEGDERLATLYTTKYRDELGPLVADLPGGAGARPGSGRRRDGDDVWTPNTGAYGPPSAGPGRAGWTAPPSGGPGWGGSEWDRPGYGPGWGYRPRPPWFLLPLLPLFLIFLVFGAIGGIVHGHLFAIVPLVLVVFLIMRLVRFGHRWGGWRR
jgi:Domain of unknown function (DUF1707)